MKLLRVPLLLLTVLGLAFSANVFAQEPPEPPDGVPEIQGSDPGNPPAPPGATMRPFKGFPQKGSRNRDPAEMEKQKKMMALRTTAEAYKQLASLYREQGKTDEAIAQLKKILQLTEQVGEKDIGKVGEQLVHVYMEIAEIYQSQNKTAEAQAILNEGFDKIKTTNPDAGSRMMLEMGNIYKKAGKTAEAEKAFQKVIDLNTENLIQKK